MKFRLHTHTHIHTLLHVIWVDGDCSTSVDCFGYIHTISLIHKHGLFVISSHLAFFIYSPCQQEYTFGWNQTDFSVGVLFCHLTHCYALD